MSSARAVVMAVGRSQGADGGLFSPRVYIPLALYIIYLYIVAEGFGAGHSQILE